MILGIEKELSVFLQAVFAGNMVYLVYSAIRIFRRIIKHNLFWVSLEDLLFWIGTGLYLFIRSFQISNGNIRWYFVVGVFIGVTITYWIIKKITKKYIAKMNKK